MAQSQSHSHSHEMNHPHGRQESAARGNPHHRFPALDAIIAVSQAAEFFRTKVDMAVAPLDITGVQYTILRVLKRVYPMGMSRTDIHAQIIEKSVDVTRSIDGLEKNGLVVRSRPQKDRRLSVATITDKGMQALEQVDPMFFSLLHKLSSVMTPDEFNELTRLSKKIMGES